MDSLRFCIHLLDRGKAFGLMATLSVWKTGRVMVIAFELIPQTASVRTLVRRHSQQTQGGDAVAGQKANDVTERKSLE